MLYWLQYVIYYMPFASQDLIWFNKLFINFCSKLLMFWPCNYAPKCSEPHKCVSKIPSVPHNYRNITIAYDITIVYDITIGVLDDATFTSKG